MPFSLFLIVLSYLNLDKVSNDGSEFPITVEVAKMSELVASLMEEADEDGSRVIKVPLPNVSTNTLRKVVEFCNHYQEVEPMRSIERGPLRSTNMADHVQLWYAEFVDDARCTKDELFELLLAANYMDIETLLNLAGPAIASRISGKSVSMRAALVCCAIAFCYWIASLTHFVSHLAF